MQAWKWYEQFKEKATKQIKNLIHQCREITSPPYNFKTGHFKLLIGRKSWQKMYKRLKKNARAKPAKRRLIFVKCVNLCKHVEFNGIFSESCQINCGVPQGSILGSLVFLLDINDVCNVWKVVDFICFFKLTTGRLCERNSISRCYPWWTFVMEKIGFIKGVDKGWITTVKDLESWRFER